METTHRPVDWVQAASAAGGAHVARLDDGATAHLRALSPGGRDDAALRRLFFTLSDTTRYLYFCTGVPASATWAEHFVSLGHPGSDRSYVLVAEVGHDLVGLARFSPRSQTDPQVTDLGILLADAWQGRGLGSHMLCRLAAEARARAVTAFAAVVLWENRRMLRLARSLFPDLHSACSSGACDLTIDLVSWSAPAGQQEMVEKDSAVQTNAW